MSKNAILCLLAAAMLGGLAALAQDEEPRPAESAEEPAEPEDAPAADDVFIPSEEVQAAEEIAFPVNI